MTTHITQDEAVALASEHMHMFHEDFVCTLCNAAIQQYIDRITADVELPEFESDDLAWFSDNPNTFDIVAWIKAYAREAVAAALVKQAVPDGFVVVPVEPTQAMCDAAQASAIDWQHSGDLWHMMMWFRIFKAMIAAAPTIKDVP